MVQITFSAALLLAALVNASPKPITPDPNGDKNLGNGANKQFITGACLSSADCATTACCAFIAGGAATGICSGLAVGNANGKAGCGFGDPGAAPAQQGTPPVQPAGTPPAQDQPVMGAIMMENGDDAPAGPAPPNDVSCSVDESLPGAAAVGFGRKNQFITGQCFSSNDCAQECCVAQPGGVALCKAQLPTKEAGLSCDFTCSP